MESLRRIRLGLAAAAVATVALAASAPSASAAASITVSPNTGLAESQMVNVSGAGYAPTNTVFIAECTSVSGVCTAALGMTSPDGSGNFGPTSITAVRTFGTGGAINCNVEGCLVIANQPMMNFATHPISFASGETLSLDPTSWDFGSVFLNTLSATRTFTVTADGTGPVDISSTAISGGISQFVRSNDSCVGTLTPPNSCTLDVTFAPVVAGPAAATLKIQSDAPGSPHTANLSGTGANQPTTTPPPAATPPPPVVTGERAGALKKCKRKKTKQARKKCRKRAQLLPL
jgi:hypothetical protein